jgi:hypothetical protein
MLFNFYICNMKIWNVTFNNGGWNSGGLPSVTVVAESSEDAKIKALEENPRYKTGYDVWVSEFKINGYVIEVYEEKSYNRDKNIEKIVTFTANEI